MHFSLNHVILDFNWFLRSWGTSFIYFFWSSVEQYLAKTLYFFAEIGEEEFANENLNAVLTVKSIQMACSFEPIQCSCFFFEIGEVVFLSAIGSAEQQ